MKKQILTLIAGAMLAVPAFAEDIAIVQKDMKFSQTVVTVKIGDKLVFRNSDDFAHNLFSMSPGSVFGSYMQLAGGVTSVPMIKEGEFEVQCAFHPKMKLLVKVHK